jgi:1-acyl-sn-glycerol-3-phosphate acyltransferase
MDFAHRWLAAGVVRWIRPIVEGSDYVPGAGPLILAANHRSNLDIVLLAAVSPRPVNYLGKRELAQQHGIGPLLVQLGMVPVDRGHGDRNALGQITDVLANGDVVGIFPEGTRSPDGALHRFRSGAARLAAKARAPVVPVGFTGTEGWWPRRDKPQARRPEIGEIAVRFGPPMDPPPDEPRPRRRFSAELEEAVAARTDQARDDTFAPVS